MRTPGSETSQYWEENKLISIPLVAASEQGTSPNPNRFRKKTLGGCKVTTDENRKVIKY